MKSELEASDTRVSDGGKSVGPRFRQNNYRERERVKCCHRVRRSPLSPGWPTFSPPSNSQKGLRDSSNSFVHIHMRV